MAARINEIINYLKRNPGSSKTNIAKVGLGLSKANNNVTNTLNEAVEGGRLVVENGLYSVPAAAASISPAPAAAVTPTPDPVTSVEVKHEGRAPATIQGWNVVPGKMGKATINGPNSNKVDLDAGECLLVINGEPVYAVTSAMDVMSCINDYTTNKGLVSFVVSDLGTGNDVGTSNDVSLESRVLALKIQKHNKAA